MPARLRLRHTRGCAWARPWRGFVLVLGLALCAASTTLWAAPVAGSYPPADQVQAITQQFQQGDQDGALRRLNQALTSTPGDAGLRFLKAVLLAETGHKAEAAALYEAMRQDYPELAEPCNNLAVLRAAEGELDSAFALLQTAVRLAPDYPIAHQNLGDVLVRLAQRAYRRAADGRDADAALRHKLALSAELLAPR